MLSKGWETCGTDDLSIVTEAYRTLQRDDLSSRQSTDLFGVIAERLCEIQNKVLGGQRLSLDQLEYLNTLLDDFESKAVYPRANCSLIRATVTINAVLRGYMLQILQNIQSNVP